MGIRKQEFYEGAALHQLARSGKVSSLRYSAPFFFFNDSVVALLKYSTRARSPWGFTFTPLEQQLLDERIEKDRLHVGLICGSDGVAAIGYEAFVSLVPGRGAAAHVACFRDHGEHYQISGPAGPLSRKVSRSQWVNLLS
jgi:hypothetical protein